MSYPKYGFQLCANGGAQILKSHDSLTNLARKFFLLYHEINNLDIKFWVKNMLVGSYSRAVIA